ncbi:hypothetical protein GPECTOR_230g517 [Gonium pectorale]|uniref:Virilizer N-terminal domain-containing protein n=1 Tax=Gonium pectorale TaxID=33097 RepID=A0A150FWJ4_GONPE|nr:hypothetical protein GPECTOR_230g517 [Gonium pectorale]|eukprot:KXZ41982.1 hypothetical protein GPECTOR_230g517 [Gonium pectorale]
MVNSQVRFNNPVTVTRIVLSAPASGPGGQQQHSAPLLRVFARDLQHPSSCRFAPLCPSNLSVGPGQSSSFASEAVVTDHVILRGRYTAVDVRLYGRADHDPAAVVAAAIASVSASAQPQDAKELQELRQQQQHLQAAAAAAGLKGAGVGSSAQPAKRPRLLQAPIALPLRVPQPVEDSVPTAAAVGEEQKERAPRAWPEGALAPAPQLLPPGAALLPLESVPPALLSALRCASDYYGVVMCSHSRIAAHPPADRLAPVMAAAKHVGRALAGWGWLTGDLEMLLASPPPPDFAPLARGELESLVEIASEWCLLLASGRSTRLEDLDVGLAGVACAVLLAVCAPAAPLLMAMGTGGAVAGVVRALCLANPPADLVRLAVACFDGLTLTCPGPAAEPQDGAGAGTGVKEEAGDAAGGGGATYGDAQARGDDEEGDPGHPAARGDGHAGDLDGDPRGPAAEGGDAAADGDGAAARMRRAGSGALLTGGGGAGEEGAAAMEDDQGLYNGFYDDFDDYYGGGEEDYEAAAAGDGDAGAADAADGGGGEAEGDGQRAGAGGGEDTEMAYQTEAGGDGGVGGPGACDGKGPERSGASGGSSGSGSSSRSSGSSSSSGGGAGGDGDDDSASSQRSDRSGRRSGDVPMQDADTAGGQGDGERGGAGTTAPGAGAAHGDAAAAVGAAPAEGEPEPETAVKAEKEGDLNRRGSSHGDERGQEHSRDRGRDRSRDRGNERDRKRDRSRDRERERRDRDRRSATQALSVLLLALRAATAAEPPPPADGDAAAAAAAAAPRLHLRNRGVVDALLTAHAVTVLSYDSLAAALAGGAAVGTSGVPGAPTGASELLPARLAAAAALGTWAEAGWEPAVLPAAFGLAHSYRKEAVADKAHMGMGYILAGAAAAAAGADGGGGGGGATASLAAAAFREPAATALSGEQSYCLLSLLGDMFPREWPPPPAPGQQSAAFPPPSNVARRSALASALETVSDQFLRLLSFGYNSESRLLRCATVRMAVKAAGLGGGMPTFLAAPLVEALAALVRGAGGGAGGAAPALTDARRLLEVLAPLAYKPTLKASAAALLDARAVSCLARFIHKLVSSALAPGLGGGGGTAGGGPGAPEAAEIPVVAGQALEALRLLVDPDLSLSPAAPREQRLREDVPSLGESTALVTALLSCLPFLGANASLAGMLLAGPAFGLATYPAGRAALRQGALKWHAAQSLLRDPDKLRALLATNPALAAIIAQNASSMGLNLSALQR